MRINNNLMAMNAHRQLSINQGGVQKSIEKLSSGMRINRAGDDAAGLAISEKMRGQIKGLNQAVRNAQDGISLIQTAEGALNESHAILQRMRELAIQASNDTNTATDRFEIQKEINQLTEELSRIGNTTEFNTMKLVDGSFNGKFQIGANSGQNIELQIGDMRADKLNVTAQAADWAADSGATGLNAATTSGVDKLTAGAYRVEISKISNAGEYAVSLKAEDGTEIGTANVTVSDSVNTVDIEVTDTDYLVNTTENTVTIGLKVDKSVAHDGSDVYGTAEGAASLYVVAEGQGISVMGQDDANAAITVINNAIERVSSERSKLGSYQNRLEHTIANLGTSAENLQAAESRIRDVDMAQEMMNFTKNQILQQASTAMLAQANMAPQSVLQLLG